MLVDRLLEIESNLQMLKENPILEDFLLNLLRVNPSHRLIIFLLSFFNFCVFLFKRLSANQAMKHAWFKDV